MLFQKKGFKGSRILSTITSYAGGNGGGCKKKQSDKAEKSTPLQVPNEDGKTRILGMPNLGQRSSNPADCKTDAPKKVQISALTQAKLACNEWNMPKTVTSRSSKSLQSSSSSTSRLRPPRKLSPMVSRYSPSFEHPAFRSSLYNGSNYLNRFQKTKVSPKNINDRIFLHLRHSLQSIQESDEENLY